MRTFAKLLSLLSLVFVAACGGGSGGSGGEQTVTVQLDWTPNTNHTGIYVALSKGWYKEAGIKVNILPYTDVNPDVVVANGKADIGVSFPPNVVFSRAQGLDVVSVASVLQRGVTEVAVLDSSDIKRPRDFDGRVYAGFGLPFEEPQIKSVIKADGGKGEFQTATLSTAAYEALYNKRADFTEIYTTWEGVEADMRGIKLRTFRYENFGVPDFPGVVLVARRDAVTKRADVLTRFLDATRKGFEYAAKEPEQAGKDFIAAVPKGTFPEPEMVLRSNKVLAPIYVDSSGRWGENSSAKWDAYSKFLLAQNIVTDDKQRVVKELPGGPLYTNELLARR